MIDKEKLADLAKQLNTNQTTITREYFQLLFLSILYEYKETQNIFFKGGTAIHLIFGGDRFSEDLDFTVELSEAKFNKFISSVFRRISGQYEIDFKKRRSIAGEKFLLTARPPILPYPVFVSLDFSFREKIREPEKTIVKTNYPVLFTSYLYHPSKDEILAEKIRAVLTREKGRDIYDLWFLLNQKAKINPKLIEEKLSYYRIKKFKKAELLSKINRFKKEDFIKDLRPFVALNNRDRLGSFFDYLCRYLQKEL
ncbi:nucleotidyl transferase AbiEii/AbiGii toxin family protein [Patescibacteria group bacterium]|nr:nucleotidyl transferase AbiEii/AbiGii toxin family protein [Patescibacteria group bacterium]